MVEQTLEQSDNRNLMSQEDLRADFIRRCEKIDGTIKQLGDYCGEVESNLEQLKKESLEKMANQVETLQQEINTQFSQLKVVDESQCSELKAATKSMTAFQTMMNE